MSEHAPQHDGVEPAGGLALADRVWESPGDRTAAALLAEPSRGRSWLCEIPAATDATSGRC